MASAVLTPSRNKRRENQFFDVGVQGRKTGITLKDTGIRDENGMMPLDGIFSSPQKSPPKQFFLARNGDMMRTSSEGSAPEATEVLSTRQMLRSGKKLFPPPMGRSPIKTSIGSSPQRLSLAASSARRAAMTPTGSLRKAPMRRLDFDKDDPIASIERSPTRTVRVGTYEIELSPLLRGKGRADVPEETIVHVSSPAQMNGRHGDNDHSLPLYEDDDSIQVLEGANQSFIGAEQMTKPTPASRKKSAVRNGDISMVHSDPFQNVPPSGAGSKRKRGSDDAIDPSLLQMDASNEPAEENNYRISPAASIAAPEEQPSSDPPEQFPADFSDEDDEYAPPPANQKSKPNGRTGKAAQAIGKLQIYEDDHTEAGAEASDNMPPPAKRATKRKKPVERDPNSRINRSSSHEVSAKPSFPPAAYVRASYTPPARSRTGSVARGASRGASAAPSNAGRRSRSRAPRTLQILRQATPSEDDGALRTRSGRTSIQPVNWWCGERVDRAHDGSIKRVTRVEELEAETRSKSTSKVKRSGAKSRARAGGAGDLEEIREEEEEDEEEGMEEWEAERRVLTGRVKSWDLATDPNLEGEDVEMEIAYGRNSIELKDVSGADFQYGKCLALPFFGAGLVDIPPGGYKRAKNSRLMQMVFFVHEGKVTVSVGDEGCVFSISAGGLWSVPRGNNYAINNDGAKPARIFFAQGCEMERED